MTPPRSSYLKRRKPLPKSTSFAKRGGKPVSVNRKRKAANLLRAHGDPDRREWIKAQPCLICGRTPSDAAHMRSGGMSRKSGVDWTAPLCSDDIRSGYVGHHSEFDAGKQSFAAKYEFDRDEAAIQTHRLWLSSREGEAA